MFKFYKTTFLPRTIFLPYLFIRIIVEIINFFNFFKFNLTKKSKTIFCIESGEKGWDLIECKEIYLSAKEFLGSNKVIKVSINRNSSYLSQIFYNVKKYKPTHYLYDSRTGSQNSIIGFCQSSIISILFQLYGIIPICTLTDLPVRSWRLQTSIVSCKRGVVVSLMSPKNISTIFPHQRIIGPMTMPFSIQTLQSINLLKEKLNKNVKKDLTFVGSLYEPRTTILKEINTELVKSNIKINMVGRELGSKKTTDEKYWLKLLDSKMIITTSNQIENNKTDWANINHLVYRYLEVPLCGSVLIAQKVPALEKYFKEDIHYISYKNSQEAVKKIIYYLDNKEELIKIAHKGHEKAVSIVNSNLYWNIVDSSLRKYSLI